MCLAPLLPLSQGCFVAPSSALQSPTACGVCYIEPSFQLLDLWLHFALLLLFVGYWQVGVHSLPKHVRSPLDLKEDIMIWFPNRNVVRHTLLLRRLGLRF